MPRPALLALVLFAFPMVAAADATVPAALAKARADAAEKVYTATEAGYASGIAVLDSVYLWSLRWCESQRSAGSKSAAADHLKRMQALETKVKIAVQAGLARPADALAAAYYKAEAEAFVAAK